MENRVVEDPPPSQLENSFFSKPTLICPLIRATSSFTASKSKLKQQQKNVATVYVTVRTSPPFARVAAMSDMQQ